MNFLQIIKKLKTSVAIKTIAQKYLIEVVASDTVLNNDTGAEKQIMKTGTADSSRNSDEAFDIYSIFGSEAISKELLNDLRLYVENLQAEANDDIYTPDSVSISKAFFVNNIKYTCTNSFLMICYNLYFTF